MERRCCTSVDDGFAEPTTLVSGFDGDIAELEKQAAATDDAAHADESVAVADDDAVQGKGQAEDGGFPALWAEACNDAEVPVFVDGRDFGCENLLGREGYHS